MCYARRVVRRRTSALAVVLCACALWAAPALAWPVDVLVDLPAGSDEIRKLSAVSWVQSEDASIADAEVLPSGELLLTGKAPGRTLVLLYAEGKFAVWRVRVSAKGEAVRKDDGASQLTAAKAACPGLTTDGTTLTAAIKDDRCRTALLALFQTDAFKAADLDLTFELAALQAQIAAIEKALKPIGIDDLKVSSRGAGLVVEGKATPAQKRSALWALFKNSVGRVPFDDRIEEKEP